MNNLLHESILFVVCRVNLHLLANGGVFLEEKVDIDVYTASTDAPGHASNNLK